MEAGRVYKVVFDPRAYDDINTWDDFRAKLQEKLCEELDVGYSLSPAVDNNVQVFLPNANFDDLASGKWGWYLWLTSASDNYPAYKLTDAYSDANLYFGSWMNREYYGDAFEAKSYYYNGAIVSSGYKNCNQCAYFFMFDTTLWTPECPMYVFSFCRRQTSEVVTEYPDVLKQLRPIVVCSTKNNDTEGEGYRGILRFSAGATDCSFDIPSDSGVYGSIPSKTRIFPTPTISLQKLRLGKYTFANDHLYLAYDSDNIFLSATQMQENMRDATENFQELKTSTGNYKILRNFRSINIGTGGNSAPVLVVKQ